MEPNFVVYVQHCGNQTVRKIVRSSSVYTLSDKKPWTTAWRFVPQNKKDFDKKAEYGRHEGDQMEKYFIIAMEG